MQLHDLWKETKCCATRKKSHICMTPRPIRGCIVVGKCIVTYNVFELQVAILKALYR